MEFGGEERKFIKIPNATEALEEIKIADAESSLKQWSDEIEISRLKKDRDHLEKQSGIDSLTGLYTRLYFESALKHSLGIITGETERKREENENEKSTREVSVAFIDLDNFKRGVNDKYGHSVGNDVLKRVADVLRASIRGNDIPARFGGDEFYVLLPDTTEAGAVVVANKILGDLNSDAFLEKFRKGEFKLGASIGVCSSRTTTEAAQLIDFADKASLQAKSGGKNQVKIYGGI